MTMWESRAAVLAEELVRSGALTDPAWKAAVREVPRHLFVPIYVVQLADGTWRTVDSAKPDDHDEWIRAVYLDRPLTTSLAVDEAGNQVAVSSSTKPGLMIRMLEYLRLADQHRVLEIGTGTGYNAGLLCHRLGSDRVVSIDVETELVDRARERLATIAYTPTLVTGDGADGVPDWAPCDRIIATCSVPGIPPAWVDQLAAGGRVLADLKITGGAGNLVDLGVTPEGVLQGRFRARWAGFMPMRGNHAEVRAAETSGGSGNRTTRTASATPWWDNQVVWFLAALHLPPGVTTGMVFDPDTGMPSASLMTTAAGSWVRVSLAEVDGCREVSGSPDDLWRAVEDAYELWFTLGEPGWDRFGLTVAGGHHTVWFDEPDGSRQWALPPAHASVT